MASLHLFKTSINNTSLKKTYKLNNEVAEVEKTNDKYSNIEYKKYNPFIFGQNSSNSKFHLWYNFVKYTILTSLFVFTLLSLWFATQWQKNTLQNLGLDFTKYLSFFNEEQSKEWTKVLEQSKDYSLDQFAGSNINNGIIQGLIAMSFVGIASIIPSLLFKNGTIYSLISNCISFISLIIVITFFSIGLSSQGEIASYYKVLETFTNSISSTKNEILKINEEITKLDPMKNKTELEKLQSTLKDLISKNSEFEAKCIDLMNKVCTYLIK